LYATKSRRLIAGVTAILVLGICEVGFTQDGQPQKDRAPADAEEQVKALRERLQTLQRRLDTQIEELQQTQAALEAAEAEAVAARATVDAIPAKTNGAAAEASRPPPTESDKLHYKGVTITLGGFLAAESVHRSLDTGNDIATAYNGSYYRNNPSSHVAQTVFSARQSSFSALLQADPGKQTHLAIFGQFDLQGAAQSAAPAQSNSYDPRLMQLYGTADWDDLRLHLLAGQAWSLATLNRTGIEPRTEVIPPIIDGQYIPGFVWARQAQLRLTQDIDPWWLALSLENSQTTFYTGPNPLPSGTVLNYEMPGNTLGYSSRDTLSLNHIPDVLFKVATDPAIGSWKMHAEAFGLYSTYYERLNYVGKNVSGGGFGAGLILPLVSRVLDLQVSILSGRGVGRYGSAQIPEVTFDPTGAIVPIHENLGLAGFTAHPTSRWDLYVFAGEERAGARAYHLNEGTADAPQIVGFGYGNILYSNGGCNSEGSGDPCVGNQRRIRQGTGGFWYKPYTGNFGTVGVGVQYSRTQIKAFAGQGGTPSAGFNMVFASIRYYPFD
jgi:hypothetical protein